MSTILLEVEREIPGTGRRAVTQEIETGDVQSELGKILALGLVRFAPGVPEWSMLRDGDRVRVTGGATYEYQAGTWVPVRDRPATTAAQGRLF